MAIRGKRGPQENASRYVGYDTRIYPRAAEKLLKECGRTLNWRRQLARALRWRAPQRWAKLRSSPPLLRSRRPSQCQNRARNAELIAEVAFEASRRRSALEEPLVSPTLQPVAQAISSMFPQIASMDRPRQYSRSARCRRQR